MADPPPLVRLHASGEEREGSAIPEEVLWMFRSHLEGSREKAAAFSDCPSADSIDDAAEFAKEREEQRLEDEKNGHFVDVREHIQAFESRFSTTTEVDGAPVIMAAPVSMVSRVSLATHKATALLKNERNLDEIMAEFKNEREGVSFEDECRLNPHPSSRLLGGEEEPGLETVKAAPINDELMVERVGLTPHAKSAAACIFEKNVGGIKQMQPINCEVGGKHAADMEFEDWVKKKGDIRRDNISSQHEENYMLDLVESRSLVEQKAGVDLLDGPADLGSNSHIHEEVSNVFEPPNYLQPTHFYDAAQNNKIPPSTHQPNLSLKSHSKKKMKSISALDPSKKLPLLLRNKPPPIFGKKPITLLKFKKSISSNSKIPHGPPLQKRHPHAADPFRFKKKDVSNAHLEGKNNIIPPKHRPLEPPEPPGEFDDDDMLDDFPSLESSYNRNSNLHKNIPSKTYTSSTLPLENPSPPSHAPHAKSPPISWVKKVAENTSPKDGKGDGTKAGKNVGADPKLQGQPNVTFGRSMADILRSGQPAEGPILLDREKAEKRGEVRIVEGKPCLFFSANETSILAGRLGHAVVGKFSHSIPSVHQIQKALGNIKFSGSISWNFLNAKHIFIELSDMSDYVKLLNGPNNSPVWYIDHHPMRVFKWSPNFDPFFESPIVTLWCNILALPVHLFEESSLIAIGEMLGKPVQVDRATINRTRVSFARLCVEVDLSRPIVEEIDIDIAGKHITLKVKWEKIPLYCNECKHVGHSALTCYASGKRPMPPKRDYSHGPPAHFRQPPISEDQPRQHGQPQNPQDVRKEGQPPPTAVRKPQSPRMPSAATFPLRRDVGASEVAPGSGYFHGSTSSVAEGPQTVENEGFIVPNKNKNKNKKKKLAAARKREELRMKEIASFVGAASDGEGGQGKDVNMPSSDNVRGARSLSPTRRSDSGFGPLAMVLHDNMFGALEDEPSDDSEASDEPQDYMVIEGDTRRMIFMRPVIEGIGSGRSSPPCEATPKRQKFSASDKPRVSHV